LHDISGYLKRIGFYLWKIIIMLLGGGEEVGAKHNTKRERAVCGQW
jgi:hypothetical protein